MIIYADIRTLIVTGIVLFLTNFGWNYPLPLKRKLQIPGNHMVMTKKSCQDSIGNRGICMFKYDCIRQKGITLSTCVDGFLFGACCFIKEDSIQIISDDIRSNQNHLIDYKGENKTNYNFYEIESDTSGNNSTENFRPVEEIYDTTLNISSSKNSSFNLTELFYHNENKFTSFKIPLPENSNNFTTFESVLKKQIYNNTTYVPSHISPNFSLSSLSEFITFFTSSVDDIKTSIKNNKSSSLDLFNNNYTENDDPVSSNATDNPESSEEINFEEYRNPVTSINSFDDNVTANNINDTVNYSIEEKGNEIENSTEFNRLIFSKLNLTDNILDSQQVFMQNTILSTENTFLFNKTEELVNNHLPASSDMKSQPSDSTESYMVSTLENIFSVVSVNEPTTFLEAANESEFENFIIADDNLTLESTQNSIALSVLATPSFQTNTESTNLVLTSVKNSASQNYSEVDESEEKKLFTANTVSINFDRLKNTTFSYKPLKSPNDSTAISNSKSSNSNKTPDDKMTTKAMLFPTLPWSSNSILPESFQSVISQLIEQKISSPEKFITDYETEATPTVDINTLIGQTLFLDSEKSVTLEYKNQNFSEFLDDEYEKLYLTEFMQPNSLHDDNFTLTSSTVSSEGLNDNFHDINRNILPVPNIYIKNFTKNEENIKLTENLNNTIPSHDESEIISDDYYSKEISQVVTDFTQLSPGDRKTVVEDSTTSLYLFSEESNAHTKLLESNSKQYMDEILFSAHTEPNTISHIDFQDSNNQDEKNTPTSTTQMLAQSFFELTTSFSYVQTQSLDKTLVKDTQFSETLTKEPTTDSHPTVIQIINNHAGKNSSAAIFSNLINNTNQSFVITDSKNSEIFGGITLKAVVNNSLENGSYLYETEISTKTFLPIIQNVYDAEESQNVHSSIHPPSRTDTSNYFNESVDSSQNTLFEIMSSYADFNSTNTFPSFLIDSSTSPFNTTAYEGTEDSELNLTDFEEQYLTYTNETFIESTDDSSNFILTEEEHPLKSNNYSSEDSVRPTDKTISTFNTISLNYSDDSSDDSFGSQIVTELGFAETSVFTDKDSDILETVPSLVLTTFADTTTFADSENSTLMISLKPTYLNTSDFSETSSALNAIPSGSSTFTVTTQKLDFINQDNVFLNTSKEYSIVNTIENTTLSTILTTLTLSAQDNKDNDSVNTDGLTKLATQIYSTPIPATTIKPKVDIHRWNYKKDCGVRLMQPVGRIVGGKNTYFGKWPWQALVKEATWLGLFVKNKCGGVLITSKYVLTAAHCQPGFLASLLVVLGTHDLAETFDNKASIIRNVKRMVVHRHYNQQTFENDLALLEMEAPVEFLPYVVPICLPHRNEDFTGKMAFVTGWGKLTAGGDVPSILQEVQVPIVSNGECQSMFYQAGHHKAIRSNFVCAGYSNGGQDSCEGDSGGPLMVQREDKRWVLIGTVSHGIGCADPNLPGVYMRMSSYRPWIDSIIYK